MPLKHENCWRTAAKASAVIIALDWRNDSTLLHKQIQTVKYNFTDLGDKICANKSIRNIKRNLGKNIYSKLFFTMNCIFPLPSGP